MTIPDRSVTTAVDQVLNCIIADLSQDTPVTWIGPDNQEIPTDDTDNYVISQGFFFLNTKTSTLTIKTAKLADLTSGDTFKCKLRSSFYPVNSPDVVKQMSLTLLTLGRSPVGLKDFVSLG